VSFVFCFAEKDIKLRTYYYSEVRNVHCATCLLYCTCT